MTPASAPAPRKRAVQDCLGNAALNALRLFLSKDIESPDALENKIFAHVADADLRKALAETHFGARWIYKAGLLTLASGVERSAHLRTQVIDYGSISEALLKNVMNHAKAKDLVASVPTKFEKLIDQANSLGVVGKALQESLHVVRKNRNRVHLLRHIDDGGTYYVRMATKALRVVTSTAQACGDWIAKHP